MTTPGNDGTRRIMLSEPETVALMNAGTASNPARLAFGPGWVAVDVLTDGSDRWVLDILAAMRGVPR